jgi:hypothetical protein
MSAALDSAPLRHDRYLAQPGVETRAIATPAQSFRIIGPPACNPLA